MDGFAAEARYYARQRGQLKLTNEGSTAVGGRLAYTERGHDEKER
jgi:hypothetical protein